MAWSPLPAGASWHGAPAREGRVTWPREYARVYRPVLARKRGHWCELLLEPAWSALRSERPRTLKRCRSTRSGGADVSGVRVFAGGAAGGPVAGVRARVRSRLCDAGIPGAP